MKILIVDDSQLSRKILGKYIEENGDQALHAKNSQEALQIYQKNQINLVIIDNELPDLQSYTLAQKIRTMRPQESKWIPIIFMTSDIEDSLIEKFIESGGDDYLMKPVSPGTLKAKIISAQKVSNMHSRLLKLLTELSMANEQLIQANIILEELSIQDPLTHLGNRRAFESAISKECQNTRRHGGWLSILMIDVDKFKNFNDSYGHQCGDKALEHVAKIMSKSLSRKTDFIARYGGEEFVVILPQTNNEGAHQVAQRLLDNISKTQIPISQDKQVHITASIGVYSTNCDDDLVEDNLIEKADIALYTAKQSGRNCITQYNQGL